MTRPSYDDELRLFELCKGGWQEILELLSEAMSDACGRTVTICFEDRGDVDHPKHPLARAELRLQEDGARLPKQLRQQLERQLLNARTGNALAERDNADALEMVETFLDAGVAATGEDAVVSINDPKEDPKRWRLWKSR